MDTILEKLAEYFETQQITQKEIAERLGVSSQYINNILSGRRAIGKKTAAKLENHFGVSSAWLLTGEGDMLKAANIAIDHSVAGNNNNVTMQTPGLIGKALDEIAAQRKLVERLVAMLEKVVEQLTSRKE